MDEHIDMDNVLNAEDEDLDMDGKPSNGRKNKDRWTGPKWMYNSSTGNGKRKCLFWFFF